MNWEVKVTKRAVKQLATIPGKDALRLSFALKGFCINPYQGDIEKIKGEESVWRRRVGSYRILFEIIGKAHAVHVFHIERRTTTTY